MQTEVTEKTLAIRYQIRNDSEYEAWILAGMGKYATDFAVETDDGGRTLRLQTRLNVPRRVFGDAFSGRYVRLGPGQARTEAISVPLPVRVWDPYHEVVGQQGLTDRVTIEIGFYFGDLPENIRGILERFEGITDPVAESELYALGRWFGGLCGYVQANEDLPQRDEEVMVPYTNQRFGGEQILRATVDGVSIPYEYEDDPSARCAPDLSSCTRIEIEYEPSALDFFFPFEGQRLLLSDEERTVLESEQTVVVSDLKALSNTVARGVFSREVIRQDSGAGVVCYRGDEPALSFRIYNGTSLVTNDGQRFDYADGFPSLRKATPPVWAIGLRLQCAANLRDLWHRLQFYRESKDKGTLFRRGRPRGVYPSARDWADVLTRTYREATGMNEVSVVRPYVCPSSAVGRCHYAMNRNCKADSPGDTVLLFETKAGWNQHGGPELFTFDNHDPKGGCVLLNDGTVKFIRTAEELRQLRWRP